jgi:hypothetical protein
MKKNIKTAQWSALRPRNLLLLIFPAVLTALAGAAPATAGLTYTGAISTEQDDTGRFNEVYRQNIGMGLRQDITNFWTVNENLRYSYSRAEPSPKTEQVAPNVDFLNDNSLFRLNLSAASVMDLERNNSLADQGTYEMGLRSKWQHDVVPTLQFVVNYFDHSSATEFSSSAREQFSVSSTADWARDAFKIYYNHRWQEIKNPETSRIETTESHNGNFAFNKRYWNNKLQVGFSQEYRNTQNDVTIGSSSGGDIPRIMNEVRAGFDDSPADFTDAATVEPRLKDGDLATTAYSVASASSFNNMVLALTTPVDRIYLYTGANLDAASLSGLTWALYSNDFLFTSWDLVSSAIAGVTYNIVRQRFEIELASLSANYLKLVLSVPLTVPTIDFTEVQVFDTREIVTAISAANNTASQSALNLGGRISRNWSFDYRANFNVQENDSYSLVRQEQVGQAGDLKYGSPDGTFDSVASVFLSSLRDQRATTTSELDIVQYSVNLNKDFLPTLSVGFAWDIRESYLASELISESTTYLINSYAQLYPDLDLSLVVNAVESEEFQAQATSSSISGAIGLTSRINPGLTLIINQGYAGRENEPQAARAQEFSSAVAVQWRPADDLFFSGNASYLDTDGPDKNPVDMRLTMGLSLTEILLLAVNYSTTVAQLVSQVGEISLQWYPHKGLEFVNGCKYMHVSDQSGNNFMAYSRVVVNFAVP